MGIAGTGGPYHLRVQIHPSSIHERAPFDAEGVAGAAPALRHRLLVGEGDAGPAGHDVEHLQVAQGEFVPEVQGA